MGEFEEIQTINRQLTAGFDSGIYAYTRWSETQKLIVVTNFSWITTSTFELKIPSDIILKWKLKDGSYTITDQLYNTSKAQLEVVNGEGKVQIRIAPSESFIYQL
jgi:hypothetical protein